MQEISTTLAQRFLEKKLSKKEADDTSINLSCQIRSELGQFWLRVLGPYLDVFTKLALSAGVNAETAKASLVLTADVNSAVERAIHDSISCVRFAIDCYRRDFRCDGSVQIILGDADLHPGGNIVVVVVGDAGTWVYRPRSLDTDQILDNAIGQFELKGSVFVPPHISLGQQSAYYWQAHLSEEPSREINWFERGRFLCLAQALGITDLHSSNVVVAGQRLGLFDTETLLQSLHNFRDIAVKSGLNIICSSHTPLSTALLPIPRGSSPEALIDAGFFGRFRASDPELTSSLGSTTEISDIAKGLTNGYQALLCDQDFEKTLCRIAVAKSTITIRRVVRATATYASIIKRASCWTVGRRSGALSEALNAALLANSKISTKVVEAEVSAMVRGSIPFFTLKLSSSAAASQVKRRVSQMRQNMETNGAIIQNLVTSVLAAPGQMTPFRPEMDLLEIPFDLRL